MHVFICYIDMFILFFFKSSIFDISYSTGNYKFLCLFVFLFSSSDTRFVHVMTARYSTITCTILMRYMYAYVIGIPHLPSLQHINNKAEVNINTEIGKKCIDLDLMKFGL